MIKAAFGAYDDHRFLRPWYNQRTVFEVWLQEVKDAQGKGNRRFVGQLKADGVSVYREAEFDGDGLSAIAPRQHFYNFAAELERLWQQEVGMPARKSRFTDLT